VLLAVYVVGLALVVLWPGGVAHGLDLSRQLRAIGLSWVTYNELESFANVVLFLPLGLLVALILPTGRWWLLVLGLIVVSGSIELAQALVPGRVASVLDVLANVTGGLAGIAVAGLIRGVTHLVRRRVAVDGRH
jgi:glycopeptide antibiotics resistance protein